MTQTGHTVELGFPACPSVSASNTQRCSSVTFLHRPIFLFSLATGGLLFFFFVGGSTLNTLKTMYVVLKMNPRTHAKHVYQPFEHHPVPLSTFCQA